MDKQHVEGSENVIDQEQINTVVYLCEQHWFREIGAENLKPEGCIPGTIRRLRLLALDPNTPTIDPSTARVYHFFDDNFQLKESIITKPLRKYIEAKCLSDLAFRELVKRTTHDTPKPAKKIFDQFKKDMQPKVDLLSTRRPRYRMEEEEG